MTEKLNNHKDRDHALLSASSAQRWLACPPSAVAAEAYPAQDTEFTREGTLAHEVAELYARGDKLANPNDPAFAEEGITQEMVECGESYRDYIQEQIETDDAVVLLEQRVDFSPWVPEGFGTGDCIIIQGDTLKLIDYKYGQGVAVSAIENAQERLYALGAINDFGFAYDIKHVETHIFQPRLNNISVEKLTVEELLKWGKDIKPVAERAAKGKGNYKPGEHCKFCPHAGRCRSLTRICTEYVETHDLRVGVPVLAAHEVAEVLKMEPLINLWLKRVKDQALTTLLDGGAVPGYKVVEGRGSRAWTEEFDVISVLKEAGYTLDQITKTELYSPAAMEKALGKKRVAELLENHIEKKAGSPTIAPDTDKRPAYDRKAEALKDFDEEV